MLSWLEEFRERGLVRRGADGHWEAVADATRGPAVPAGVDPARA
jgi:hypothetical protein